MAGAASTAVSRCAMFRQQQGGLSVWPVVESKTSFACLSTCRTMTGTALRCRFPHKVQIGFRSPVPAHAIAAEQDVVSAEPSTARSEQVSTLDQYQKTKYYFLIANAKFMLDEEEHFQELMQERGRNYGERNKARDFWLVIEPQFLDNFPKLADRLNRPAVALVSTDPVWITFMKLRLDRVLKGEYEADTLAEALAGNSVELKFEKPTIWKAPYPKYEGEWWTPFLLEEA